MSLVILFCFSLCPMAKNHSDFTPFASVNICPRGLFLGRLENSPNSQFVFEEKSWIPNLYGSTCFFWNADEWALIAHQDWSIVEVVNMCQKANFMKLLFI